MTFAKTEKTKSSVQSSKFFNSSCLFLTEVALDVDIHPRTVYIAGNVQIISKSCDNPQTAKGGKYANGSSFTIVKEIFVTA